jgi:dolichol-phosphate mannosyltransferase
MIKQSFVSHKILTIIPAFNEAKNIGQVVIKALNCPLITELLVVDDGSKDRTSIIARKNGAKVIKHKENLGVGAAIRTGIDYAIKNKFTIATILAGDDQHNPSEITRLVEAIIQDKCDFCIGSRYLKSSNFTNPTLFRLLTTKLYTFIFNIFLGTKLTDATNGFRAFRIGIFKDKEINIWQDWLNTYELEPYLLYQVVKRDYRFKEIPCTIIYHDGVKSHIKPFIGWWKILRPLFLLKLKLKK